MTTAPVLALATPQDLAGLDREQVIAAIAILFEEDGKAQRRASQLIEILLAEGAQWSREEDLLAKSSEVVCHLAGNGLAAMFEHPGNVALLRLANGRFALMRGRDERWFAVDAAGAESVEFPALPDGIAAEDIEEALLLQIAVAPPPALTAMEALRRVLRLAAAEVGVASILINGGQLLLPLFSMLFYNKIVNNGAFSTLWALTLGMLIYLAADVAMRMIRNWATERIATELAQRDDAAMWSRLAGQDEPPKGGFARFLSNYRELAAMRDFVSSSYLLSLADVPFFALYLLAIAAVAWPLVFVVLALAAVYAALGMRNHLRLRAAGREAERATIRKTAFLGEALASLDVVRLSPGGALFERRWRALCRDAATRESERRMTQANSAVLTITTATATSVVVLVAGAYLVEARMMSVGGLIAATLLASRAMSTVASLFGVVTKMQDFRRAVSRLELAFEAPAAADPDAPRIARPQASGRIQIHGLAKRYPGRPPALTDISLRIEPGERIGLLGPPGAGKSTLLRCLARFARADAGEILYDGASLADLDRADLRRWLAYKAQDPALFAGTLEENIRVALAPTESGAQWRMEQALWASGLEDELRAGRMTLSMALDEQGRNLSGGQRQKVALARVLAQGARILLLDEPSLGLDPESEKALADRLPQVMASEDVLVMVSHSAGMLKAAGRVIVLDAGRIVADGERDRLVRVA
jgi:ATP-binding cassette subfamily B protein/ATP-binding cassette subfamily C protein LapB